ncbi:MAG: 16S rRNA (cytosine(1402)-N(4))-methyltransferase [Candidatus Lloydbacteria bacterium RIFCSPLOWO2_12_FULL_51_9]|uniref:Ribosomal RNA small subunit methyltransferase H n=1 Tax=Candidatus Lloydbacteria bacterium RIFCSPLOWO2_12_FULL_51_9 TaxID=1798669 RepID=A0A1G2DUS2_9BACT|nr:MAG: 16S rRNA (cytosine(1402)-N(4))-methyltransferase [Candidatus Lloydbacteria bacterium RIFCSPLOWO2_12_FULL_51_9]
MAEHIPVLKKEVIDGLLLADGDRVFDATLGGGGHAQAICGAIGKRGTLVGTDLDEGALRRTKESTRGCAGTVRLVRENFRNVDVVLEREGVSTIDKALFDLGMSSLELDASGRGFSFKKDEPLLMTFDSSPTYGAHTAEEIVNAWPEEEIARILKEYGEERFARRIAQAIALRRKVKRIERTGELAEIVSASIPARFRRSDSPVKTFQALRIAVNDELGALKEGLEKVAAHLAPQGRIAVISFHSLEDRIVKRYFRELATEGKFRIVTKKPIVPSEEEVMRNPRSRSAKLRIIEKCQS